MTMLVMLVAIGCSSVTKPDAVAVKPIERPTLLPYRVGITPVVVDDIFKSYLQAVRDKHQTTHTWTYSLGEDEAREISQQIAQGLEGRHTFAKVMLLEEAQRRPFNEVLQSAWTENLDLVIRPVLRKYDGRYVGTTDWWVPNLILWLLLLPPLTWFIADEQFGCDMAVALEFYSTATQSLKPFLRGDATGSVTHTVDDFQQGFNLFNLFITPDDVGSGAWEEIGKNLCPLVKQALMRDAASYCEEAGRLKSQLDSKRDHLRKTLAVVVGCSPLEATAPLYATEEALRLSAALTRPRGGIGGQSRALPPLIQPWALQTLDGPRATKSSLDAALSRVKELALDGDRVLLVLTCRGIVDATGQSYLMLSDCVAGQAESGVSVAELGRRLGELPALVAVVTAVEWDTSQWRDAPASSPDDATPVNTNTNTTHPVKRPKAGKVWAELAKQANVLVIASSVEAEPLLELEEARGSLWLEQIVHRLAKGADLDTDGNVDDADTNGGGDGFLSWSEIIGSLIADIRVLAGREGIPQHPDILGSADAAKAGFFRLRALDE